MFFDRYAFANRPLVFLGDINDRGSHWVSISDCIWTRSILRNKYALEPTLPKYCELFRKTLAVPNATMDMLVNDLLKATTRARVEDDDEYRYVQDLLREMSRAPRRSDALAQLDDAKCWPCRTPTCSREFRSIGNFFVNDRQDLFDIFSSTHTFLDFGFDASRKIAGLFPHRRCHSFLSENVSIKTESREPLVDDDGLTQDLRGRADALAKYSTPCVRETPHVSLLMLV